VVTNVYIDGFNLYYRALKRSPEHKWLNPRALCELLLTRNEIQRIRYFTALVSARSDDPQQPARQQAYLRALATVPGLSVHLGTFTTHKVRARLADPPPEGPNTVKVYKTEEKGSDVNLATYLLLDAAKGNCEVAVVVSNDSDLKEPIAVTEREFGIPVGILNPQRGRSRDLRSTFYKDIRAGALAASQFPDVLEDAKGEIHRPDDWRAP